MNGPSHDWGILRGADGIRYRVVGPRGGPYTSRPMLPPWQLLTRLRPQWQSPHAPPPPPMPILLPPTAPADEAMPTLTAVKADDDVVEQAMQINLETDEALSVARNSVSIINGVSAMLKMTRYMLAQRLIKIYNTNQGLLAHDVHYAYPLRILLLSSWRLRINLNCGLQAQLAHIGKMFSSRQIR